VQQQVYKTAANDVDELKQRLINVWDGVGQNIVNNSVDE